MKYRLISAIIVIALFASGVYAWSYTTPPASLLDSTGFKFGNSWISSTGIITDEAIITTITGISINSGSLTVNGWISGNSINGIVNASAYGTIQDAYDATPTGGTLYFPIEGSPYTTGQITVSKSIRLLGEQGTRILRTAGAGGDTGIFYINGDNIGVDSLILDGNGNANGDGIVIDGADNTHLSSITITDMPQAPIIMYDGTNTTIINSLFYGNSANSVIQSYRSSYFRIENNNIYSNDGMGINLGTSTTQNHNGKIINNFIDGTSGTLAGDYGAIYGRNPTDILISGNSITNFDFGSMRGIYILGGTDNKVSGNYIYNVANTGIDFDENYFGIAIGNNINTTASHCIAWAAEDSGIVSENSLDNCGLDGISISAGGGQTAKDNMISNNVINNTGQYGIQSQGAGGSEINNTIINNRIGQTVNDKTRNNGDATNTFIQNKGAAPFDFGIKSAAPTSYGAGDMYYDSDINKRCFYNSTGWAQMDDSVTACS